ncbi:Shedu anti-phage system protein SduA domain-containing protein [Micromonospora sp. NPDC047527]|uniref:Shedu anti-phage system protein SduA domain-containing protein n=1 Tax=Micromonospora sp. NPDC047527 TaxID=3155144 RepID=UPI0033E9AAB2
MDWDEYERRVHAEFGRAGHRKMCAHDAVGDVDDALVAEYRAELDRAMDESPMQGFLEKHPAMLVGELGPQCRWVLPRVTLAGKYVPDFLTARLDSTGVKWTLIELESPRVEKLFTRDGTPARQLAKGIAQISDWRSWLGNNQDMARRPRSEHGLGLIGIEGYITPGLLIIGRASDRTDDVRPRLNQLMAQNMINIRSYDWLTREVTKRREFRERFGSVCDECVTTS